MRVTILAGFLFLVPTLLAQESGQLKLAVHAVQTGQSNQTSRSASEKDYDPAPAGTVLSAGQPLDPRDVDILTGKTRREAREARLYHYRYTLGERDDLDYRVGTYRHRWNRKLHTPVLPRSFFRSVHARPFRMIHRPRAFFFLTW